MDSLLAIFSKTFSLVAHPAERMYWPFLISSLLIIYFYTKDKFAQDFKSPSSLLDLKVLSINLVLKTLLFPFFIFSSFGVSVFLLKFLRSIFPDFQGLEYSLFMQSMIATFIAFMVNDFLRFLQHFFMHKIKILFELHKTHHSALVLTPFTLFRNHPLESFIALMRNTLTIGITLALYSFLFFGKVDLYDILGVNILGFLFNGALANLRHSSVPISFGFLEYLFISPRMHQIHHSNNPIHFNKNYGVALSVWDQIMGSFYRPTKSELSNLGFGLSQENSPEDYLKATTLKGAFLSFDFRK